MFNDCVEIFFFNFSIANMAGNEMQWEVQTMIEQTPHFMRVTEVRHIFDLTLIKP